MSPPQPPPSHPRDLPTSSEEDWNFDDPPSYIKNEHVKMCWCLNKNVRDRIMENRPKVVFFCFHKSFCTFQVDNDPNTARMRIEHHFKKHPNHRISTQDLHQWDRLSSERRNMRNSRRIKNPSHLRSASYHNSPRGI